MRIYQLLLVLFVTAVPGRWAYSDEQIDYARQIKPLLAKRCYACHGALKQQGGLRLDTAIFARKGGDGGPAVEPGKSDESLLIEAVQGVDGVRRMPPKDEGEALPAEDIALLRAWIDQGARAPEGEEPQADPRKHWAFQRVERPAVPVVNNPAWVRNPIDAFVAAGQEAHGVVPTAPADRATLLRRVHLDLTGLPPTREQLHAYLKDDASDAYERVVERLLESPQYGERWARHWMDVWRYSDWYGRRAVPDVWNSAPQVWRWRDWIVNSLNGDKGYEQMVMEMLAADEIAPEDDEAAVATGYIIRNWYALNPHQWMKDMVEHTGKAFLGLTFNCAHCHDHKYDPITQEEYFRFRSFFEPVQVRQDRRSGEPDPGPFQKYEYTVLRKVMPHGSVRIFDENLKAETFMYRSGDERERFADKPPVAPGAPAFLGGDKLAIATVMLPAKAYYPGLKPFIREAETLAREQTLQAARAALPSAQQALVAALTRLTEIEAQQLAALQGAPGGGAQPPPVDPKLLDRKAAAQTSVRTAQHAARLAAAHLATEQALSKSLAARIAADKARYDEPSGMATAEAAAAVEALSQAASRAERTANLRGAEEKQIAAAHAVELARLNADGAAAGPSKEKATSALQASEQQLTAADEAIGKAREALAADSTTYSPLSPVYPAESTGRRKALAEWIARRDNPLTARVAVNHIWSRHFGRALVDSVFDFGVNGKRPSHPELLDWLAAELMEGEGSADTWRMKHLHRLIVTSNTYRQASSAGVGTNPNLVVDPDNRWMWRFAARRAEAEVVRDSLLFASGQLDLKMGGPPIDNTDEVAARRRSLYFNVHPEDGGHPKFLELFDAPDPCDCYKRSDSMVPQQALALTNSQLILNQSRLLGRLLWYDATSLGQSDGERQAIFITAAFERILSRAPTPAEMNTCREFLERQTELFRTAEPQPALAAAAQGAVVAATEPLVRACASLVHALFSHNDFVTIR